MKLIDLTGMKFGNLTVIERAENSKDGHVRWNCVCNCGKVKEKPVSPQDLKNGKVVYFEVKYNRSGKVIKDGSKYVDEFLW